ncbi:hypothetical protein [Cohnella sp.]|uniref:hypothetical protein n=1 Tax=Cohnella sp. TaxID=1883426 RepID=UPI003561DAA5
MATFEIQLKDRKIVLDDIIDLSAEQAERILKEAPKKTQSQWLSDEARGVKIPLSDQQISEVLQYRDQFVSGRSVEQLISENRVRFTDHFNRRASLRVDGGRAFPKSETLFGLLGIAINSDDLVKNAEWKGYSRLGYSFEGVYQNEKCVVSVTFESKMILITVTSQAQTPQTTQLGNYITAEKLARIRAMAARYRGDKGENKKGK